MLDQETFDCWYENYQELKEISQKKNKEAKLFKQKKVRVIVVSFFLEITTF